jgi:uncharacterized protein YndB with AHSA1/START domain
VTVEHETWTVERTYPASPPRVFEAWGNPALKQRWFTVGAAGGSPPYSSDFRVGGVESTGTPAGVTPRITYEAVYRDIVENERIVLTYEMSIDGRRMSISVVTVELSAAASGTRLTYTEQGVYLDDLDTAARRRGGLGTQLEQLGQQLDDPRR